MRFKGITHHQRTYAKAVTHDEMNEAGHTIEHPIDAPALIAAQLKVDVDDQQAMIERWRVTAGTQNSLRDV